jgi:phosphatidate cytidylyltransferase
VRDVLIRAATTIVAGGFFFAAFAAGPPFFIFVLGLVLSVALCDEWPLLVPRLRYWRFLWTFVYPTLPAGLLGYFYVRFWASNILVPLYPFIVAWACDTAAYFAGRLFGRHKLCPTISPKKTWEGALGGFLGVFVVHFFLRRSAPHAFWFLQSWVGMILVSIAVAILAIAGDLSISFLKRRAGIKDSGTLLPGHGGVLDRFDSVFFVAYLLPLFWRSPPGR